MTECEVLGGRATIKGYVYHWKRGPWYGRPEHVARWERENGPLPKGHHLHHVCHNRACVNVGHLALMTEAAHLGHHREIRHAETQDHAPEWYEHHRGSTQCRICRRRAWHRWNAKKKAA